MRDNACIKQTSTIRRDVSRQTYQEQPRTFGELFLMCDSSETNEASQLRKVFSPPLAWFLKSWIEWDLLHLIESEMGILASRKKAWGSYSAGNSGRRKRWWIGNENSSAAPLNVTMTLHLHEHLLLAPFASSTVGPDIPGLLISYNAGLRHNFCCRGPILIPRPDSETSAQTTRVNVLDFFCKT